jgi:hypothetical protein
MLDRLIESQKQLCLRRIWLEQENGLSVIFDQPVLFDRDIVKIIGANPIKRDERNDELFFKYLMTRIEDNTNGRYDIPVTFHFRKKEDEYKLVKAHAGKDVKDILSYDLLNQIFLSACKAKRKGGTVIIGLANVDLSQLPKLKEIKQILGDPHRIHFDTFIYYYKLNPSDTAEIIISYDNEADRLSSVKIKYFRYLLDVNFDKKIAIAKIKNWSDMVALGFWVSFSP